MPTECFNADGAWFLRMSAFSVCKLWTQRVDRKAHLLVGQEALTLRNGLGGWILRLSHKVAYVCIDHD